MATVYVKALAGYSEKVELRNRRAQCGNKQQYRRKSEAVIAAREHRERFGEPKDIYLCPWCRHYHLGKMRR